MPVFTKNRSPNSVEPSDDPSDKAAADEQGDEPAADDERDEPENEERCRKPTPYDPKICEELVELMAEGWSLDACAYQLNIPVGTLEYWAESKIEVATAFQIGRSAAVAYWEERLRDVANGGRGSLAAIQFALRNRSRGARGWNLDCLINKGARELSLDPAASNQTIDRLDVSSLSDEELDILERVLRKTVGAETDSVPGSSMGTRGRSRAAGAGGKVKV